MGTVHVLWNTAEQSQPAPVAKDAIADGAGCSVYFNQSGGFNYLQPQRPSGMPAANSEIATRMHRLNSLVQDAMSTPRKSHRQSQTTLTCIEDEMSLILDKLRTRAQREA